MSSFGKGWTTTIGPDTFGSMDEYDVAEDRPRRWHRKGNTFITCAWPHPIRSTDTDSAHELATSLGWHLAAED